LRGLIKLLEKTRRKVVYTDFADQVGDTTEIDLPLGGSAGDFERFWLKVRAFLRAHENYLTRHKLRRNQPLTATDLTELARLLVDSGTSSADDLQRASAEAHGLGLFVRSLVGLDREAATQAFTSFAPQGRTRCLPLRRWMNCLMCWSTSKPLRWRLNDVLGLWPSWNMHIQLCK
jgi:type I restriction enzyme R subunit